MVNVNLKTLPDEELHQLEQQIFSEWRSRLKSNAQTSNNLPNTPQEVNKQAIEIPTNSDLRPDPVIDAYKNDVDRTLIQANLKLSIQERIENLMKLQQFADELRKAGKPVKQ